MGCSKSNAPVDLKAGLVGSWSPDDESGFTLARGVTVEPGTNGKVFSFAKTGGSVVVSNSARLNFSTEKNFSIATRIKPLRADTMFGVMSILDKRQVSGTAAALGYTLHLEDGRLACQLAPKVPWLTFADFKSPVRLIGAWQRRKALAPMAFARFISKSPDLRDGQFHDVALTVDRRSKTGGKLYVDGAVVLTFDPTKQASSLANSAPLLIGGHADATLRCDFRGEMGPVRLYSRAITPAEVAALLQKTDATNGGQR